MDKQSIRKKYKLLRSHLTTKQVEDFSLNIANNALKLNIWQSTYYHIFLPISEKKEVNTEYLLHILQGKDKSIVVPKADFVSGEMKHILLQENTKLVCSEHGIPEPLEGIFLDPTQIEVVFVPLLAFDKSGNRVGYGKGFYDRFLSKCSHKTIFIGLSFFEAEDKILYENIDIPLHYCITPSKIHTF